MVAADPAVIFVEKSAGNGADALKLIHHFPHIALREKLPRVARNEAHIIQLVRGADRFLDLIEVFFRDYLRKFAVYFDDPLVAVDLRPDVFRHVEYRPLVRGLAVFAENSIKLVQQYSPLVYIYAERKFAPLHNYSFYVYSLHHIYFVAKDVKYNFFVIFRDNSAIFEQKRFAVSARDSDVSFPRLARSVDRAAHQSYFQRS